MVDPFNEAYEEECNRITRRPEEPLKVAESPAAAAQGGRNQPRTAVFPVPGPGFTPFCMRPTTIR